MKIEKNTAVTLRYTVSDTTGKLLEESKEPMCYLHGGYGNTFAKIEGKCSMNPRQSRQGNRRYFW